jgi:phage shock protein C
MIAGVCAGIAEYLHLRPVGVRAAFATASLLGGAAVVVYVVLWLALPAADSPVPGTFDLEDFRAQ